LNHRSVRDFTDETLTDEQIQTIVESAQRASTSSFIHAYSISGVTDEANPERMKQSLSDYDALIHDYYMVRGSNPRKDTWTGQMGRMLSKSTRLDVKDFLKAQGYLKQ
jgi:nitroreductase